MSRAVDALPELSFADAEAVVREPVQSVRAIGYGSRARVFRVETAEGAVRVVRLSAKGTGRVEREAWVRGRLKRHPDVPLLAELRVRGVPLEALVDVVTMAELPGTTLAVAEGALAEHELWPLWKRAGECLGAVHETLVASFGLLDGAGHGPFSRWRDAFASIAASALEEARVAGLEDLALRARPVLEACASSLPPASLARLAHGDPQPGNVQVHRGALVALLDWEFAQGADPDYELAALEAHLGAPAARRRRTHFYEGYSSRREPWSPAPAGRRRAYSLAHALRASEYLTAVGPTVSPDERALATRSVRARIERWLDDPAE